MGGSSYISTCVAGMSSKNTLWVHNLFSCGGGLLTSRVAFLSSKYGNLCHLILHGKLLFKALILWIRHRSMKNLQASSGPVEFGQ